MHSSNFFYAACQVWQQPDKNPIHRKLRQNKLQSKVSRLWTFNADASATGQQLMGELDDQRWVYWGDTIPPKHFSNTSKRLNATLNEVAVTAIARGISRYIAAMNAGEVETKTASGENRRALWSRLQYTATHRYRI
jgi:hypothetical protein